MSLPEVTVLIPVYNRAGMLTQALESCRRQTLRPFRVFISDNASTDDLRAVAARFPDLDIHYHRHEQPIPPVANFVFAGASSETPYMKFLCSDDLLLPEALETMLAALRSQPEAAVCLGGYGEFIEEGNGTIRLRKLFAPLLPRHGRIRRWLDLDTTVCSCFAGTMYATRPFQDVGGIHPQLEAVTDWEVYLALLARFPVVKVDRLVCAMRLHEQQWVKQVAFTGGAQAMHDVFMLTSPKRNPLHARLGLPSSQQSYLRQQSCWAALRNVLASPDRGRNLRLWAAEVKRAEMWPALLLGFPSWAACKLGEKLIRTLANAPARAELAVDDPTRNGIVDALQRALAGSPPADSRPGNFPLSS